MAKPEAEIAADVRRRRLEGRLSGKCRREDHAPGRGLDSDRALRRVEQERDVTRRDLVEHFVEPRRGEESTGGDMLVTAPERDLAVSSALALPANQITIVASASTADSRAKWFMISSRVAA